jgi:hypothetical protein
MTSSTRVVARYLETTPKSASLTRRVVARYTSKVGMEFDSPEALKKYLKDHPDADKSKHTVKKPGDEEPTQEEPGSEDKGRGEKKPESKFMSALKAFGDRAVQVLKDAPAAIQQFAVDKDHRDHVLLEVHAALTKTPEVVLKRVTRTVKKEIHEFKEAGQAIKNYATGRKVSEEQKKALKQVAFHVALTATVAALVTSGPLAGAAFFGKSIAKHIAMKAVADTMGQVHVLQEISHVGEALLTASKKPDPEEAFARLILSSVAAQLKEGLSDEDIQEALEDDSEDDTLEI